jgi:hypothetical protein
MAVLAAPKKDVSYVSGAVTHLSRLNAGFLKMSEHQDKTYHTPFALGLQNTYM